MADELVGTLIEVGVKTIAFSTKLLFSQFGISTVISVSSSFSLADFFGGWSVGTSQTQWA
jgi:hypothetical protein